MNVNSQKDKKEIDILIYQNGVLCLIEIKKAVSLAETFDGFVESIRGAGIK